MDRGVFLAAHSAQVMMERQALIANNLANVSTPGFKRLVQQQQTWIPDGPGKVSSRGYAVETTPSMDARPGALMRTENPLHIALGEGVYLGVEISGGQQVFTRRGDLQLNEQSELVFSGGEKALSEQGTPMQIPQGFKPMIGSDGTISAQDPANLANMVEVGRLQLVSAPASALKQHDSGWLSLDNFEPLAAGTAKVTPGMLEASNVNSAQVLTEMIEVARVYELNTKLMTTFQEMDRRSSDLLGSYR